MVVDAKVFLLARVLILLILISMTRAFALVSLLEVLLVGLVVFSKELRAECASTFKYTPVKLIMVFWAWTLISGLWSEAHWSESFKEFWSWRKLLLIPIIMATFQDHRWKSRLLLTVVVISSFFMMVSWAGYLGILELDRAPSQLLENHATQGIFFAFSTFILVLFVREHWIRDWRVKMISVLLCAGFTANLFVILTGRSGYLFFLVGCSFLVFVSAVKYKAALTAAVMVLVSGSLFVFETPKSRVIQAFEEIRSVDSEEVEYSSLGIRTVMWRTTWTMIENKPLLGSGAGGFSLDYGEIVKTEPGWRSQVADDPHQQFMHIAAEHGLIGLSLFLCALIAWAKSISRSTPLYRDAGLIILLGICATSLANGHFNTFVEGRLVWMILAVCASGIGFRSNVRISRTS